MVRPDDVGNVIVLTLIIALVAAILLFGKIALDLVELPPALSGPQRCQRAMALDARIEAAGEAHE